MAAPIPKAKKRFYKGPAFFFSLVLHLAAAMIVLVLLAPLLFLPERNKKIIAVDVVNEKDISQKLPDPATLGGNQIAKPKPIGGRTASTATQQSTIAAATNTVTGNKTKGTLPTNGQLAAVNIAQKNKKGDSDKTVPKILKTIDKIRATPDDKGKTDENKSRYDSKQQSIITNDKTPIGTKDALSREEFFALRAQVVTCWQIPAGLRDIDKTTITVLLSLSPDGKIQTVSLKNPELLNNDSTRVLAESALRSFAAPACQKLKLPKEKYPYWKKIEFTFDPYYAL